MKDDFIFTSESVTEDIPINSAIRSATPLSITFFNKIPFPG